MARLILLVACAVIGGILIMKTTEARIMRHGGLTPPPLSRYISGGHRALENSWPWQVEIYYRDYWEPYTLCGGSVIGKRWIVTAAHCFYDMGTTRYKDSDFFFLVGAHNITRPQDGRQRIQTVKAEKIYDHELYDNALFDYDIALVKVDEDIIFGSNVQPVKLAKTEAPDGFDCIVTGFGRTAPNMSGSKLLLQVLLPIVNRKQCVDSYETVLREGADIKETMICAGGVAPGRKTTCGGDSGGPLVCSYSADNWELNGVVNFGLDCGDTRTPGVFASIPFYRSWIQGITGDI